MSARVSYLELSIDDIKGIKQKCSGLIASTGVLVWLSVFPEDITVQSPS